MNYQSLLLLAQAAAPAGQQPPNPLTQMVVPFVCIGIIFYFLIIRPQAKKAKEQQTLISSLKPGDKVVTTGGIHGILISVKDSTVTVKVADNVKIEVDKAAVVAVTKRTDDASAA
jgi:preprotein translocase subunit YajC